MGDRVYFVKLTANDGRVGYAPFVVRPTTLGERSRVAGRDADEHVAGLQLPRRRRNGWGDTWYAKGAQSTATLGRMYIRRGVPPQWRKYDVDFIRWLHATGKQPEFVTESDLESIRTAEELISLDVVFPGHTEYVTRHEYDLMRNYRDLGGNLAFLSATTSSGRCSCGAGRCGGRGLWRRSAARVVPAGRPVPRQRRRPPSAPFVVGRPRPHLVLGRNRPRRRRHASARSSAATGSRSTPRRPVDPARRSCSQRSRTSSGRA